MQGSNYVPKCLGGEQDSECIKLPGISGISQARVQRTKQRVLKRQPLYCGRVHTQRTTTAGQRGNAPVDGGLNGQTAAIKVLLMIRKVTRAVIREKTNRKVIC